MVSGCKAIPLDDQRVGVHSRRQSHRINVLVDAGRTPSADWTALAVRQDVFSRVASRLAEYDQTCGPEPGGE
jgi:uncharacterized protein YlxW (UPF0749 family)